MFSEDTSYKMRALLRLVVTKGTGKKADAPGYRVGGKTGTAREDIDDRYRSTGDELRRRVPDGRAALCDRRHARRAQGDRRDLSASAPPAGTSPRSCQPTVSRIAPMLGVRPDKKREPNMAEVLPYVHEKDE